MPAQDKAHDPVKVAAGHAGALTRWGVPRVVRIDDFPADERLAILAGIAARRAAKAARNEKAELGVETSSASREGHGNDQRPAA